MVSIKVAGHVLEWSFLKAAVAFPLIGTDFLVHFKLAVNIASMMLYTLGQPGIQLAAPPAGKVFAMVGVQPAAADAQGIPLAGSSSPSLASSS